MSGSVSLPRGVRGKEMTLVIVGDAPQEPMGVDDVVLTVGDLGGDVIRVVHEIREWRYLQKNAAGLQDTRLAERIEQRAKEVLLGLLQKNQESLDSVPALEAERRKLELELLGSLAPGQRLLARWSLPLDRLDPASHQWALGDQPQMQTVLSDDRPLLGVTVAGLEENPAKVALELLINGKPAKATLRRQVFLDTWYTRGETRIADAMVLCPSSGQGWSVALEPGEAAAFLIELPSLPAGDYQVALRLNSGGANASLQTRLSVLQAAMPANALRLFEYLAFCYPDRTFMRASLADSIRDMEKLGVSAFEVPSLPRHRFSPEGRLLSIDWSGFHEECLKAIKETALSPMLFIEPEMKTLAAENGAAIPWGSEAWERAYTEVLQSFGKTAARIGIPPHRLINLAKDEAFSRNHAQAPDEQMQLAVKAFRISKQALPEMRTLSTMTGYASYEDWTALLPYVDIAVPHWPFPTKVTRFAPPSYNPREAWLQRIFPMLKKTQAERPLEIWSYHIASGKSDDLLKLNLAYPTLAANAGLTGAGDWAYNVASGSSWDDTDGNILDYLLAYDGGEDHPINRKWNTASERIVPSIRWFALREGLRDARILRALMTEHASSPELAALLRKIENVAGKDGYGSDALTYQWYSQYRDQLREAYQKAITLANGTAESK